MQPDVSHTMDTTYRPIFPTILFLLMLSLVMIPAEARAVKGGAESPTANPVPSCLVMLEDTHCLLVEKSTQKLMVYHVDGNDIRLIRKYSCSTGKNHGDKTKSGDRRTPEGVYYFRKIYTRQQLQPRYGEMAFVLSFPNSHDKIRGKGGNGIWLHGLDRPLLPNDSQGCIALRNDDIREISRYIDLFKTPIIIAEKLDYTNLQGLEKDRQEVMTFLERWVESWEGKNLQQYVLCYSRKKFKPGGWEQWERHKQSLNSRYKFIAVDTGTMNILKYDGTFTITFMQSYESDRFSSFGSKELLVQRNSDDLKIITENWVRSKGAEAAEGFRPSEKRKMMRFLNDWIAFWEAKQIQHYMACYSKQFRSQGMGWEQWKKHKSAINANNTIIRVSVIKPNISIDRHTATVTYIQKYASDAYTDYGLKRLQLKKEEGSWKIIAEDWEPL